MQICSVKYQLLFCKKLFYENTAPGSRFDIQAFAGAGRVRLSIILAGILESLFIPFTSIFLLAILTPVNLILFICKNKNLIQSLLDGSNAARILAFDYVHNLLRQLQLFLCNDFFVLDDIYGNIMIDKTKDIQIQILDGAFNLDDILFSHFLAAGIFDDSNRTVQLIQLQVMIDRHCLAGFDMIQNITLTKSTYV